MTRLAQLRADAKAAGWADWIRSEADERAMLDGHYFDVSAGCHICDFIERFIYFSRGDLAGETFTLLDWQRDEFLMPLFGWRKPDGKRRFAKADVFIAKKCGKSTLSAAIVNYVLTTGGPRTECYGMAHTREQASIIYREAAAMVRESPQLAARFKVRDSQKRILYPDRSSYYQVLAGEAGAKSVEGIDASLIVLDEIHVFRSRELYAAITYASLANPNSLLLSVSTVGVADESTIWWEQYEYCKGILDGSIVDHARFALLYQADEACRDDVAMRRDPAQWAKAMPSIGHTISEEKVLEQVVEAENSPRKEGELLRYVFNLPTAQVDKVVPVHLWDACATAEEPDLHGRVCYGGLDMASSQDLAALALLFPDAGPEGVPYVKCWAWCPEETIREHEMRGRAHYVQWVKDGYLHTTGGNRIDHDVILSLIRKYADEYQIVDLGFDPWNADAVINPLMMDGVNCVSVAQTLAGMSMGTTLLLDTITEQSVSHGGNKVMSWCLGNAGCVSKEEARRFSKSDSAGKIDLAVAAAIAFGRWAASAEVADQLPQVW